eukprot:TRINITY_DN2393_c0_g6_i1.p1 TRINITY_DN2393_c0_g6~~TRINITY_DN2393_c0_g6_i1.p1  ORF type:complete len:187 (+),score=54.73 TRINITY_DN2393_c0_g6_i1:614-1174(+)
MPHRQKQPRYNHSKPLVMPRENVDRVVNRLYGDAESKRKYMNYLARTKEKMLEKELSGYFKPNVNVRKSAQPSSLTRKQPAAPKEDPKKAISVHTGKSKLKFRGCKSTRETPAKNTIVKNLENNKSPEKTVRSARRRESIERKAYTRLERKTGKNCRMAGDHVKFFVPDYKAHNIVKRLYDSRIKS